MACAGEDGLVAIVSRSDALLEQAQSECEQAGLHVHAFASDLTDADQAQAVIDAIIARHRHFLGQPQPSLRAVVNIVGIRGRAAMPEHIAGGAANAALIMTSQGLAQAYGREGLRIYVINPGFTLPHVPRRPLAHGSAHWREP